MLVSPEIQKGVEALDEDICNEAIPDFVVNGDLVDDFSQTVSTNNSEQIEKDLIISNNENNSANDSINAEHFHGAIHTV